MVFQNILIKLFRPKVIVPDTNILVDNLGDIKTLADYGDFSLKVPTTVLVELEGLCKDTGRQEVKSPEMRKELSVSLSFVSGPGQ